MVSSSSLISRILEVLAPLQTSGLRNVLGLFMTIMGMDDCGQIAEVQGENGGNCGGGEVVGAVEDGRRSGVTRERRRRFLKQR